LLVLRSGAGRTLDLQKKHRAGTLMTNSDRREFLKSAAMGLAASAIGPSAMPVRAAPAGEPAAGTVIDTHTHFYDPTRPQGVPWPEKGDKLLYRRVLPEDFRSVTKGLHVTGTVVVEASPLVEDNQWVLDLAAKDRSLVGLVGHLTPGGDGFPDQLKGFARDPLFRGIRISGGDLETRLAQPRFVNDLKRLADEDLEVDVNGGPDMLPGVARLAGRVPDLRLVINHVANVPIDGKAVRRDWLAGMRAAAKHAHVFCKVSALVEGTGRTKGDAPADVEFYRPVLDALWETFGEDRRVYGSNWPVSERFAPYARVLAIVRSYFQGKGKSATEKFFWRNALAAYKWVQR
jgi:predicted TIM-barrel fold metal-dependent hydrolase